MKTVVHYISDIHLDFFQEFLSPANIRKKAKELGTESWEEASGAIWQEKFFSFLPKNGKNDILVLVGDIWEAGKWHSFMGNSWIAQVCSMFREVVMLYGNHDYWNIELQKLWRYKCLAESVSKNLHILDRDSWQDPVSGAIFIGASLWTDMFKHDPMAIANADRCMNDFSRIPWMTTNNWLIAHQKDVDYIKHCLYNISQGSQKDKPVIVVTHHAPTSLSVSPAWRGNQTNAYYYSDLSDILLDNKLTWLHGHIHSQSDYMIGESRVLCNPLGYVGYETQLGGVATNSFDI